MLTPNKPNGHGRGWAVSKMGYDWDAHRETCHRLYITERRSVEDIIQYMRTHHKFSPSKRAFQTQFRKWDFPVKANPAFKNTQLVARIKELWEQNLPQAEMLRALHDEGFNIKQRELVRVRTRNRWLLRAPNNDATRSRPTPDGQSPATQNDGDKDDDIENGDQLAGLAHPILGSNAQSLGYDGPADSPVEAADPGPAAKKDERHRQMAAESEERWATKKRRRRTRPWAGLPADPPDRLPRFPSETTLEESRSILNLERDLYQDIRLRFQRICQDAGVVKKSLAGPEKWESVKEQLVQETPHLQVVMRASGEKTESKKLALDVVCTDVTKRLRTTEKRLTVAEAKNILRINPDESREIRAAFYKILQDDLFTSKLEAGAERWQELKQQWLNSSRLLRKILAPGNTDPGHDEKVKAIDALARDTSKRLRDDPTRRNRFEKKPDTVKTPPTRIQLTVTELGEMDEDEVLDVHDYVPQVSQITLIPDTPSSQMQVHLPVALHPSPQHMQEHSPQQLHSQPQLLPGPVIDPHTGMHIDSQLDSSLLLAADAQAAFVDQQYVPQFATAQVFHAPATIEVPVYFRLHPTSTYITHQSLWIDTLRSHSVDELRHVAVLKYPDAVCTGVQGVLQSGDGTELFIQISSDEELGAFLNDTRMTASFVVQLIHHWPDM